MSGELGLPGVHPARHHSGTTRTVYFPASSFTAVPILSAVAVVLVDDEDGCDDGAEGEGDARLEWSSTCFTHTCSKRTPSLPSVVSTILTTSPTSSSSRLTMRVSPTFQSLPRTLYADKSPAGPTSLTVTVFLEPAERVGET